MDQTTALESLHNPSAEVRQKAVEFLRGISDANVVDELTRLSLDSDKRVRVSALKLLGETKVPDVCTALIKSANDHSWPIRRAAVNAIGQLYRSQQHIGAPKCPLEVDQAAVEQLTSCVQDHWWEVREAAVSTLAFFRSDESIAALTIALSDSIGSIKSLAICSLAEIGTDKAYRAIADTLTKYDRGQHITARHAIAKAGFSATAIAMERDDIDASQLRLILNELGAGSFEYVASLLDHPNDNARGAAVGALADTNQFAALDLLHKCLADPSATVRLAAIKALGEARNAASSFALLNALYRESDSQLLFEIGKAIGQINDPAIVRDLTRVLEHTNLSDTRWAAALALEWMSGPRTVAALTKALCDEEPSIRRIAAIGLGSSRDPRALPVLASAANDTEDSVRVAVANALATLAEEDGIPTLTDLLRDTSVSVRCAAVAALGEVPVDHDVMRALELLLDDPSTEIQRAAAQTLRRKGYRDPQRRVSVPYDSDSVDEPMACAQLISEDTPGIGLGASAPQSVAPGDGFTTTLAVYMQYLENEVKLQLEMMSERSTVHMGLKRCQWQHGTVVTAMLSGTGLLIDQPKIDFAWNSVCEFVHFDCRIPVDAQPATTVLKIDLAIAGLTVASIRLDLKVEQYPAWERHVSVGARAIKDAFASYSSKDRLRVLDMVEAIEIVTGIDVFVDCLRIRGGANWEDRLLYELDIRDALLLFWSDNARKSEWVTYEWESALKRPDKCEIKVLPLEAVDPALTPKALAHLQFTDPTMWSRVAIENFVAPSGVLGH